ncbi:MAG TPA: MFS transporter [Candidatus Limnocylindrales bacterium]|nr:MFS transporter [Candidatus Limnocylindrales bacterium]
MSDTDVERGADPSHPLPRAALGMRAVLRYPDLRRLVVAQAISDIGDGMTFTALLLLVNAVTDSTAALALMSIALAVPPFTIGLVAGAIADRHDRRRIMLVADTVRAVLVAGLAFAGTSQSLPVLYLLAFAQAGVGSFFSPARSALIPRTVPPEGLLAASALNQTTRVAFGVLGTAVTGLVAATLGVVWPVFLADAATFLASVAIVSRVSPSIGRLQDAGEPSKRGLAASVVDGLGIVARSRTLVATLLGTVVALLGLGAVNVLFIPLIVDELRAGPAWLGPVELAQVASMILAASIVAPIATRLGPPRVVVLGLAGVGAAVGALSFATSIWIVLAAVFAVGWFLTPLHGATTTLVQTTAGDAARGRVAGAFQAAMSAAQVASMALAGVFADLFAVRDVFLVGGLTCLLGAGCAALLYPRASLRRAAVPATTGTTSDPSPTPA